MLKAIGLRPCGVDLAGEAAFLRGFGRARRGNRHTASVRRPARHHPTAACRQFRRELQHARFVRMVFDRPPERLRLEPHPAPARCRPPVLIGTAGRRRRPPPSLRLLRQRNLTVHHDGSVWRGASRPAADRRPAGSAHTATRCRLFLRAVPRQFGYHQPRAYRVPDRARVGRPHDPHRGGQVERRLTPAGGSRPGPRPQPRRPSRSARPRYTSSGVGVAGNAMPDAVLLATGFGAPWQLSSSR